MNFKQPGWSVKRAKGKVPAYDLIITKDRSSILVEVKHDEMSDLTGNYCLEKASLDHTQSSALIIGTPQLAYAVPIDTARKLFDKYPKKQTGDCFSNFSALVPKSVFDKHDFQHLSPHNYLNLLSLCEY